MTKTNSDFSIGSAIIRNPLGLKEPVAEATQRDKRNQKITVAEVKALQDVRRYIATRLHNQSHFNPVDRYYLNEIMPRVNSALTKLEDQVSFP